MLACKNISFLQHLTFLYQTWKMGHRHGLGRSVKQLEKVLSCEGDSLNAKQTLSSEAAYRFYSVVIWLSLQVSTDAGLGERPNKVVSVRIPSLHIIYQKYIGGTALWQNKCLLAHTIPGLIPSTKTKINYSSNLGEMQQEGRDNEGSFRLGNGVISAL